MRPQRLSAQGVERLITLNVNGQTRRVDVLPGETLAMTLRYKLGLTGTKLGCDRAECGVVGEGPRDLAVDIGRAQIGTQALHR